MNLLAISGSLRLDSSHSRLIKALVALSPSGVHWQIFRELEALPAYNPDLDSEGGEIPRVVSELRSHVGRSSGIVISTPEYAHGVPGVLKNALDWLVASSEFPDKPVLLQASGIFVEAHLSETLKTMSCRLSVMRQIPSALLRQVIDSNGVVSQPELLQPLKHDLESFLKQLSPI